MGFCITRRKKSVMTKQIHLTKGVVLAMSNARGLKTKISPLKIQLFKYSSDSNNFLFHQHCTTQDLSL